jgi:general secretion pathway protein I
MSLRRVRKGREKQRGFSLLELLVAFAIMAMSLALLYRMAGGSARHTADIALQQESVWLVQSVLASRSSVRGDGWNEEGESAGLKWQVRSAPYGSQVQGVQVIPLHQIHVLVTWATGSRPGQLEVTTLLPERKPRPGEAVR